MHTDLEALLQAAENDYLQDDEIGLFQQHAMSLAKRLEAYEYLRDQEVNIFQPVADALLVEFPQENPKTLERALKHWLAILRTCAMAMLLNSPEFLQRRLLEWLTEIVRAHQMEAIETQLCLLLKGRLKVVLSEEQFTLIQPLIDQAQATFFRSAVVHDAEL